MLGYWGMHRTPLLPLLPGLLWPGMVAPDIVLSIGQLDLNWIAWNSTVFTFNCVSAKICVLMLNWTVGNRAVFDI